MKRPKRRWSGEYDRHYGPFTLYRSDKDNASYTAVIDSGTDHDSVGDPHFPYLLLSFGRTTIITELPTWILGPTKIPRVVSGWKRETIERLGRNWYYDVTDRRFGFSLSNDFFQLFLGTESKGYFVPWMAHTHIRHSVYDDHGNVVEDGSRPTVDYRVHMGGAEVVVSTVVEEREWHRGEGAFKWIRWFTPPITRRIMEISFRDSILSELMEDGESRDQAMRRWGRKHNAIQYIGRVDSSSEE